MSAAASSTLKYLSLAVYPQVPSYWWPAGPIVIALVTATLAMLAIASYRMPEERPRALGLMAIILSMLCVAIAVGFSRSGLGPDAALASRYITLTTPLLCAMYAAWLVYARKVARSGIHLGLCALMCLAYPACNHFGREYGLFVRNAELRVERCLRGRVPTTVVMGRACPSLYPDAGVILRSFKMLKAAGVGAFAEFEVERVATTPEAADAVRR
jgi:hypothetical protein